MTEAQLRLAQHIKNIIDVYHQTTDIPADQLALAAQYGVYQFLKEHVK